MTTALKRRVTALEQRRGLVDQSDQVDLSSLTDEQLRELERLMRDDPGAAEVLWQRLIDKRGCPK